MRKITIVGMDDGTNHGSFRAYTNHCEGTGETAGQALDNLAKKMGPTKDMMVIVVQSTEPDEFFSQADQKRLRELMDAHQVAVNTGTELSEPLRTEMHTLIDKELIGATRRTEALMKAVRS